MLIYKETLYLNDFLVENYRYVSSYISWKLYI